MILFPTDFGPAARGAWPYALELAKAFDSPIHILHVVELLPWDSAIYPVVPALPTVEEVLRRGAENQFARLRAEAAAVGVCLHVEVIVGRIRTEIARAAHEAGEVLIVMGRPVRSRLGRWVLGDVAGWVVQCVPCPVLVVPAGTGGAAASSRRQIDLGSAPSPFPRAAAA